MFKSKLALLLIVASASLLSACGLAAAGSVPLCSDGGWLPVEDEVSIVRGSETWGTYDVYLITSYDTIEVWARLPDGDFPLGDGPSPVPEEGGAPTDIEISYSRGVFLIGYGRVQVRQCSTRLYYKNISIEADSSVTPNL